MLDKPVRKILASPIEQSLSYSGTPIYVISHWKHPFENPVYTYTMLPIVHKNSTQPSYINFQNFYMTIYAAIFKALHCLKYLSLLQWYIPSTWNS